MNNFLGSDRVETSLRALSGAVGFVLLLLGLGFLILPEVFATAVLAAETARAVGINSLRADFGALFLGMSLFCLLGALSRHRWLLLVPGVFLALIVAGRLTSFVVDDLPMVMARALVMELVFLVVLCLAVLSHALSSRAEQRPRALEAVVKVRFLAALGAVLIVVVVAFMSQRQIGMRLLKGAVSAGAMRDPIGALPDGLHVGLVGTGAPLPDRKRVGGSTFVLAGKHLFIVDSGPGSTRNLELMRVPLGEIEAVLLTHFHSDHIAGLGELMLKAWTNGARTTPLRVMGPEGVATVVAGFNQALSLDAEYRTAHHGRTVAPAEGSGGVPAPVTGFGEDRSTVVFETADLKVTAFLVDHRPVEPALGYRFDYKGRSVVISGDCLPDETLRRQSRGVDLLLHEALDPEMVLAMNRASSSGGRVVGAKVTSDIPDYHTFPEEAARIARDAGVGHLVLHHVIPPLPVRILYAAFLGDSRKIYEGPITVGEEGMVFSLPADAASIDMEWLL